MANYEYKLHIKDTHGTTHYSSLLPKNGHNLQLIILS